MSEELIPSAAEEDEATGSRGRYLARVRILFGKNRMLWTAALVACVALVVGIVAGRSLAPAQAETPQSGLITAPVVWGELRNELVVRGDVAYADAVEVVLDTAALAGPAVVTGRVPEIGSELAPLSVALEVSGRPVIVLPGDVPAYRTLHAGLSGPDVVQVKTALRAVGLDGGDPSDDTFDEVTAGAIAQLYERVGYAVPPGAAEAAEAARLAEEAVASAELSQAMARHDLETAQAGPPAADIVAADNAVASAQRELDAARAAGEGALVIAGLEDAFQLAKVQRQALAEAPETTAEQIALTGADQALAAAREASNLARQDALPTLPAAEVLYLSALPRRVDEVAAVRGGTLAGAAMKVSGATLALTASVSENDARLLAAGVEAFFDLPDGTEHRAVVATSAADDAGGWRVQLVPDALTPEMVEQLRGQNVRVRVPVGATEGAVLSVPAAALSAGTGGETRVEVVDGDPKDGDRAERRLVAVETGLATPDGVEIRAIDGAIEQGDLVVVGR